ncbi:hypothetical protein J2X48_005310 [Bosea sp. BE271]|jgi:hypothetical protein|uniref:hypothetical protein n=1 Tax=Bosea TaxID=85413 RepID=UPI0027409B64|nr:MULTISPECIES: hypothetical protein [Bosea]MDR6831641.1 hypothetical protein [Bosea robiniae]MDR6898355.1 hypothetical protein [Bosea sp. BE109]MDR7141752.1 hypothetical protein [Bosea sp. BE168]MDR7178357.1 hypothetical protein [Bosea sp. BE271]
MTGHLLHQVEIRLDKVSAGERLRRIEAWCGDWQIGFRVLDTMTAGIVRIAFEEARFARAFVSHFGGVIVPADELEAAMAADADAEDAFDRQAAEYNVED